MKLSGSWSPIACFNTWYRRDKYGKVRSIDWLHNLHLFCLLALWLAYLRLRSFIYLLDSNYLAHISIEPPVSWPNCSLIKKKIICLCLLAYKYDLNILIKCPELQFGWFAVILSFKGIQAPNSVHNGRFNLCRCLGWMSSNFLARHLVRCLRYNAERVCKLKSSFTLGVKLRVVA